MGNCLILLGLKREKRSVTLLLVGLDNAGKTTAAKGIVGDPVEDVAPTVGFAPETLEYRGCQITIYDLGGGNKIRPVWTKYFSEVHGVIFVVDSSDGARIQECRDVLNKLLADKKISGKPVLVLANKQDVEGAMDEIDLVESLNVEQIVNKYKCPTRVETCSAVTTRKQKPDKPIADGFRWLVDTIVVHYKEINKRVEKDLQKERDQQKKELEERKERLRRLRIERERQEALRSGASPRSLAPLDRGEAEAASAAATVNSSNSSSSSSVPNGTLPQSKKSTVKKEGLQNSGDADAQELKELGFSSRTDLHDSTSSSSPQVSPDHTGNIKTCASVHVGAAASEGDGPAKPHVGAAASEGDGPAKPHRVILVQESPTHQAPAALNPLSHPASGDSGSPQLNGYITANGFARHKLELRNEERQGECIPIDSDDELFDLQSVSSHTKDRASPFTLTESSRASITSYIKTEQLELEYPSKPSKKKSFLKRYHKTAPLVPAGASASTVVDQA